MSPRILSLVFAFLTLASPAGAAPGDLDPTFGTGGTVTTAIGARADWAYSVAIDGSGRIVVAGSGTGQDFDFALARYDANGNLDPTFGTGGKVVTGIGSSDDSGYSVAIDGSGRIVVAGESLDGSSVGFALARFDANGILDPSFGSGGKVATAFGPANAAGRSVVIDGSGRIVVAGFARNGSNFDFALARYDAVGTLDPAFGSGGKVTTPIGSSDDFGVAMAIDGSGRIVVAGGTTNAGNSDFALARYDANGSLDATFGSGGKVTTSFGASDDFGYAIAIDGSGRILVAGSSWSASTGQFVLARYDTSGSLDPTFGSGGKVSTSFGPSFAEARSVVVDASGRIVVAGKSHGGSRWDFALARYDASGNLDPTFGSGGKVTTALGSYEDHGASVAIDGSGRIVVAGFSYDGAYPDFALARYVGTECGNSIVESGEQCDVTTSGDCCSSTCQLESSAVVCRASTGECDVEETCTGASATCPADSLASAGTSCTDDGNVCTDDQCNGSGACTHPNNTASCDDGFFCNGADSCGGGSCSGHVGDPCADGPDCASTCDEGLDTCNAPAGTACSSDGSVCSLDVCDGSGACTHPAANAGTTCRAAAGDCDLPEACDGTSPSCPTDLLQPSSHTCRSGAGECDVAERCSGVGADCPADGFAAAGIACTDDGQACTHDACDGSGACEHVALPDSDGDSVCDAQDVCTNVGGGQDFVGQPKPKLVLAKANTDPTPGNEKLVLKGSFNLAAGVAFGDVDPSKHGARVVVRTALGASVLDVVLPAQTYAGSGTRGWKANTKRSVWQYLDKTGTPLNGVIGLKATDKSKGVAGGVVAVAVTGKDGTYPVTTDDEALKVIVVLGNQSDAIAGSCGERSFTPIECSFNGAETTLVCKQ